MDKKPFTKLLNGKRLPKKCGTRVDRLSELPDHLVVHILSFLPLKKAAATSVISKRWLDLWKHTSKLNFVEYNKYCPRTELREYKYVNWVNLVLDSYMSLSLQEFTIAFLLDKSNQYHVTRWLEFAFLRRVERMNWIHEYAAVKREENVVHEEILNALTLKSSDYQSLKVLRFEKFRMSGHVVEFFLRNCGSLERLVLDFSTMTSDLDVVGGSSLKHLEICSRLNETSVKVCASNLIWLTLDHDSSRVFLENVPKLVNMHFYSRYGDTMHDFAKVAAQLETLIITLNHPTESFSVPEMPKLKKLVVYYSYVDLNIRIPITCLIQASPCLEEFILEISELGVDREVFEIPKGGPMLLHRHLKRFVLSGYCGGCCDRIELVKYVVDNCVALEKIVIGKCDRIGLVRDMVDYCAPLDDYFAANFGNGMVVTAEQQRALETTIQLLQIPDRIKLSLV